MRHYLLTRFNVYSAEYFKGDLEKFHDWSRSRITLFEKFTLPSVLAARRKAEFDWVIFFDGASCAEIMALCEGRLAAHEFIKPVFVPHGEGLGGGVIRAAQNFIADTAGTARYVLTTRIDNDDCMHVDYMKTIQKDAQGLTARAPVAINYETGICYDGTEGKAFRMKVPNMFVSLLEARSRIVTVFSSPHDRIGEKNDLVTSPGARPLWLMNVHGGNWANTVKNGQKVHDLSNYGPFPKAPAPESAPALRVQAWRAGAGVNVACETAALPTAEFAFYLIRDGATIERKWYGPRPSAVFDSTPEGGALRVRVFLRSGSEVLAKVTVPVKGAQA